MCCLTHLTLRCGLLQAALAIVDEDDVPIIVRALLNALSSVTRADILRSIRSHGAQLPPSALPLVVEMLGTTLRVDAAAACTYLEQLEADVRPVQSKIRVLLFAACTLNAAGQYRVSLCRCGNRT